MTRNKPRIELYVQEPPAGSADATPSALDAKFSTLKGWGIDQVVVETLASGQSAAKAGLGVVLANWWSTDKTTDFIAAVVKSAATISTLCEIKMADEPIYWQLSQFKSARTGAATTWLYTPAAFAAARSTVYSNWPGPNPIPPLSLSFYGPEESWDILESEFYSQSLPTIDLLRVNNYPYCDPNHYRQIWMWNENARRYMSLANVDIPICTTLQAWANPDSHSEKRMMPTPQELRVMAYQVLLSGAAVVSFYQFEPANWALFPDYQNQFQAMVQDLVQFINALQVGNATSILGYDSVVRTWLTDSNGNRSMYYVNTGHAPNYNNNLAGLEIATANIPQTWPWQTSTVAQPLSTGAAPTRPKPWSLPPGSKPRSI